jgi:hypothetical protein
MTVYDKKGEGWIPAETLSKSCRRESSSDAVQATAIGPKEGLFSSLRRALNTPSTTTPQQDYDLYIQRETDKYERNVKSQQLQQQIQLDVAAEALRRQLKK